VKRNHGAEDGIWLPVQSYGAMSMSSSTPGYVFFEKGATKCHCGHSERGEKRDLLSQSEGQLVPFLVAIAILMKETD